VSEPVPDKLLNYAWFLAKRKGPDDPRGTELAQRVTRVATDLETARFRQRWRSLTYFRHMTGRLTFASYCYGMARRPSALLADYETLLFTPPEFNACGAFSDVYMNRVWSNQPFVTAVPIRGDFNARQRAKYLPQWVDGLDAETGFWDQVPKIGLDANTYGTGWAWLEADYKRKQVLFERVQDDELLWPNEDGELVDQGWVIRRVWGNRYALRYLHRDDPDAVRAIDNAPQAYPAVDFISRVDYADVIAYLKAYKLPDKGSTKADDKPGRACIVVGDYTIEDREYNFPELPAIPLTFTDINTGFKGQGLVEQICRTQQSVNRMIGTVQMNMRRHGDSRWLVEANSQVNPDALGNDGRGGGNIVKYTQTAPQLITPAVITEQILKEIDREIQWMATRVHVSTQAVVGEAPKSLQSAVALEKYDQITDVNFQAASKRLEAFVVRCAYMKIRIGRELKVSVTLSGRKRQLIDWKQVDIPENKVGMQAYPMSRLPQTIAGRQEIIDAQLANNEISRETHMRLSQVPDVDGEQDLENAPQESVVRKLDKMIETGEYQPPNAFADLAYAIEYAESRYTLEEEEDTPQDRLDLILMFKAACEDLQTQKQTPPPLPGPTTQTPTPAPGGPPNATVPGFGIQPPATAPIIPPSPPQVAPVLTPP
jgi:hypothetical protein